MKTTRLVIAIALFFPVTLYANEKPNVIVIMADDIGFECYSECGGPVGA